jgi:hypothetical protein
MTDYDCQGNRLSTSMIDPEQSIKSTVIGVSKITVRSGVSECVLVTHFRVEEVGKEQSF